MSSKIRVLSDQTINQIAAGEVIENPASVVKELVENAIDAGGVHLKIEILGGGFQLIKISDDGTGMSQEDAILSLQRHATSKISNSEDLFSLKTMGFRGEALASIAAISKMRLVTALENSAAVDLEVEGGKTVHMGSAARSRGTTIEVRSLFYNVPARKKFQKSPAASSAEITKVITQLALAHPEVGFEWIQQSRSHFSLPSSSGENFVTLLKKRSDALLSAEFTPSCRDFEFKEGEYEGIGLIADPQFSRHNRSGQYLFINRRPVSCPSIAYAIRDAFGTRLSSDRHPVYLLHLTIPSHLVDVNVHPQKKEVRLQEEGILKYALRSSVNAAFGNAEILPCDTPAFSSFFSQVEPFNYSETLVFKEEAGVPLVQELPIQDTPHVIGLYGKYAVLDAKSFPSVSSGIVWVDLPAAEARVQFDALLKASVSTPLSQGLLIPASFHFSKAESALLKAHLQTLQKLGIQVREAAETAFIVDGLPPFLNEGELHSVLIEMIGQLQGLESQRTHKEEDLRALAAALSRKTRFSRRFYSLHETELIVQKLLCSSDPLHCPQGKKTLFHIKEEEIENYFAAPSR